MSPSGTIGFALNGLKQAMYRDHARRLLLLPYDTLVSDPAAAMAAVYAFTGLPPFPHDFEAGTFDAGESDARLGTPGLHDVRRQVRAIERETILPPDLWERSEPTSIWRMASMRPAAGTARKPGQSGGANAILSHVAALQRLGYAISFAAADEMASSASLEAAGLTVLGSPFYASVEEVLRRQSGCFDVVYLHRVEMAARYGHLVRQHVPHARLLYSVADLHHLRLLRQAAVQGEPALLAASRKYGAMEQAAATAADAVLTHSHAEAALLRRLASAAQVHCIPWSVSPQPARPAFGKRSGVAFIGLFRPRAQHGRGDLAGRDGHAAGVAASSRVELRDRRAHQAAAEGLALIRSRYSEEAVAKALAEVVLGEASGLQQTG